MEYFVIIRGPLGVGKTTIARKLASVLQAEYVSIDSVLEESGLDKIIRNCIPVVNFIKANEIVLSDKKVVSSKITVFDGNFYHKSHKPS